MPGKLQHPVDYTKLGELELYAMHDQICYALTRDVAAVGNGEKASFGVYRSKAWKDQAEGLEAEMMSRKMLFTAINW